MKARAKFPQGKNPLTSHPHKVDTLSKIMQLKQNGYTADMIGMCTLSRAADIGVLSFMETPGPVHIPEHLGVELE